MKLAATFAATAAAMLLATSANAATIVDVTATYMVESKLINCGPNDQTYCGITFYSYPGGSASFDLDQLTDGEVSTKSFSNEYYSYSITIQRVRGDLLTPLSGTYEHNYKLEGVVGDYVGSGTAIRFAAVGNAVPEPATWAMMILGFGAVGYAMRRKTVLRFV